MSLINKEKLMQAMYHRAFETDGDTMWQSGCWVRYRAIENVIKSQPEQPERMKGHWIHVNDDADGNSWYECSCCHKGEVHVPIVEVSYCWNCGAKMEGELE